MAAWAKQVEDGWLLSVYVQPGAKVTGVVGLHGQDLKLRIAAPPVEGRANALLEEFIARTLGVPRRCVSVVKGAASRRKSVRVVATRVSLEPLERGG